MRNVAFSVIGCLLVSGLLAPPAKADYPNCSDIQQPKITQAVATEEGVQYGWESKGGGATYKILISRYYDGEWHEEGGWEGSKWSPVGGALGTFVPWDKDFKVADSVALQVIQECYGRAWGVPSTVQRNAAPATPQYVSTAYVSLTPNKKWTEITVSWAAVLGATEYRVSLAYPKSLTRCEVTITGTSFLWTEDSTCELRSRFGSYSAWVTPIGPNINGQLTASEYLTREKPKIRCVKKSNLKVKSFKRKKCPKGWVER